MKTLHKIFHHGLYKFYIYNLLGSICALFLIHFASDKETPGYEAVNNIIILVLSFYLVLSPFMIFVKNNYLYQNIKSLINQRFNRKDLIKFSFQSQLIRIVLFVLQCTTLIFIGIILSPDEIKAEKLIESFVGLKTFHDFFQNIYYVTLSLIATYMSGHLLTNSQEVQNLRTRQQSLSLTQMWNFKYVIVVSLTIITYLLYDIPEIIIMIGVYFLVFFICSGLFNRTFKIYSKESFQKIALSFSSLATIPFLVLGLLIAQEASNKSLPYQSRVSSVLLIGNLNMSYGKVEMSELLKASSDNDFGNLLLLFKDRVSFKSLLNSANSNKKVIRTANIFTQKKLDTNQINIFIDFVENYKNVHNLDSEFISKLSYFFSKQKVNQDIVETYINSNSELKQFAAVILAQKNMNNKQYLDYLEDNKRRILPVVLANKKIQRSIAGMKEQLKSPDAKMTSGQ